MARRTLFAASIFMIAAAAQAQEMFRDSPISATEIRATGQADHPYALRSRVATLAGHQFFSAVKDRNRFVLNLFPDARFDATVADARVRPQGASFVYATLADGGYATLFVERNVVRGHVNSPQGFYVVKSAGASDYVNIIQIDRSKQVPNHPGDLHRDLGPPMSLLPTAATSASDEDWMADFGPDETVDMLAVYTDVAEVREGGRAEIEATIVAQVEQLNQTLANSGLGHRSVRLVAMERVEPNVSEDAAGNVLRDPKGFAFEDPAGALDEVFELRHRYAGDIVHLFHASSPNTACGVGGIYLLREHRVAEERCAEDETSARLGVEPEKCATAVRRQFWRNSGFSNSSVRCGTGTIFTHEVGHVLGVSHDRYTDRPLLSLEDPIYFPVRPYGFGHVHLNASRRICTVTVMSYATRCSDEGYARVAQELMFSNPDLDLGNAANGDSPAGVPGTEWTVDTDGPVNAAKAIDDVWDFVANLFSKTESGHDVPLMPAAGDVRRQGFVRVINHDAEAGEVTVVAFDDDGNAADPVTLAIGGSETMHFNSDDLELGNAIKGLSGDIGEGSGDWRLKLTSLLEIEVLAYVRTTDGFLTAMHDLMPATGPGRRAGFFNPGSNPNQVSLLRLINDYDEEADVRITGIDDDGAESAEVRILIPPFATRTYTAKELEEGSDDFEGALGDGFGKWRLFLESEWQWSEWWDPPEAHMRVMAMSLLENPTGHLTNLSSVSRNEFRGTHIVPLFPAKTARARQGFARVVNPNEGTAEVSILAYDDNGKAYGPVALRLEAGATAHFNTDDLEDGNESKGLSGALGSGFGDWRLELSSESKIDVFAYVRTDDGFVTTMHDAVPSRIHSHRIATFNPASNVNQVSSLRLVNPGDRAVNMEITGVDGGGQSKGVGLRISLPAKASRTFAAQDLEVGAPGINGSLGDGTDKWQLLIQADREILAMSLMESPTGHLTNLSTAPVRGVGPWLSLE